MTKAKKIDDICRQNIEDYDYRVSVAWGYMDRMRCPLSMARNLALKIQEIIEEYGPELGIDIDTDEVTPEDVISA